VIEHLKSIYTRTLALHSCKTLFQILSVVRSKVTKVPTGLGDSGAAAGHAGSAYFKLCLMLESICDADWCQ
jgi:hypothetical protein